MSQVYIYGMQFSPFVRIVQLVCEEKNIAYDIGMQQGSQTVEFQSDEHALLHPFRKIPALQHNGKVLAETNSICRYLDSNFTGISLTPDDPWIKAKMDEWCELVTTYISHAIVRDYLLELVFPKGDDGKPRIDVLKANRPAAQHAVQLIANQLQEQDYLFAGQLTLADLVTAPCLYYAASLPEKFALVEPDSSLHQYLSRLQQRESAKKVLIPKA
ncbi:glutathione S-transferase family protein [Neptunicella sp. SCSIO 80796]|uniref:glutathione S-transferase family protein n=1 Tax=Neptunicella plasticusilytica TaxID=3117012 RepID=UPI003A4DEFB5